MNSNDRRCVQNKCLKQRGFGLFNYLAIYLDRMEKIHQKKKHLQGVN
jgi:hypothetical protein